MRKLKYGVVLFGMIFLISKNVNAASGSLGVSAGSVYVGDSFTVTANVNAAAAWSVHVVANGPVSGCTIHQADATADALDTNKSFSATCVATGVGTIFINLSGDATSAADGNAVPLSGSRSVSVSERPVSNPVPSPSPSPSPSPAPVTGGNNNNNSNNNNRNNQNKADDNKSNNNNIKELKVEGYELTRLDNNQYTLVVPNDVTSINVLATAEDEKARIDGARKYDLNVGENSIDIVIVSESGAENRINIKVTRKDGYYLEDLDSLLKNDKPKDIDITINADTKLTSSDVEKIKKSKKKVKLNYYNDDKSLLYSLIISGKKIKAVSAFETEVKFDSENRENILKLSNYADGLYFSKKQGNKVPKGTLIKLFVGNKYTNKDIVNIYSFDSALEKLVTIKTNLKVKDGYVEFEFPKNKDFFVTMSMVGATKETTFLQKVLNNAFGALLLLVVLTLGVVLKVILKKKRDNKLNVFDK